MTAPTVTETVGNSHAETADNDAVAVASAPDVAAHILRAIEDGHGLVPRSSTGQARHGRGTARGDARLLDLSALRQVPLLDARQRVAIVEAGVSFGELQPLLDAEGLRLCHPLLPPAGKSVVASLMDREPTLVPKYHWDFTDPLLCAELWFGTGDRFRTGSAAGPGATLEDQWRAGMFQKNPLGPAQTDIAKLAQGSQGALGIATWASVRLELAPRIRRYLRVGSDDLRALAAFAAAATRRRLGDEVLAFDRWQLAHLAESLGLGAHSNATAWSLLLVVGSLPKRPEQSMAVQLGELRELAARCGVALEDLDGTPGEELLRAVTGLALPFGTTAAGTSGTTGTDSGAESGDFKDWKRHATGESRELSFLTTMNRAAPLIERIRESWAGIVGDGMIGTYLQPINQGRTCHVEVTAFVTPMAAERIDGGTARLVGDLIDAGAFFSRPIGAAVEPVYRRCGDVVRTLHKVKGVLDPHGVLSPGALCFDPAVAAAAFQEVSSS